MISNRQSKNKQKNCNQFFLKKYVDIKKIEIFIFLGDDSDFVQQKRRQRPAARLSPKKKEKKILRERLLRAPNSRATRRIHSGRMISTR